jgi:hypothetical protein
MIVNVYTYKGAARRERYKHKTARNGAQTKVGAGSAEKGAHIGQYKHNKKGTNLQAGSGEKGTSSKYLAGNGAQTKVQEKNAEKRHHQRWYKHQCTSRNRWGKTSPYPRHS